MKKDLVLITGAVLSSDNASIDLYNTIISWFDRDNYEVLSPLDTMKFQGNDIQRYERAMSLVKNAKIIIAEMSNISTGQGMELQEANRLDVPILVIAKNNSKISGLVKGCKSLKKILYYENIDEIQNSVLNFIGQYM